MGIWKRIFGGDDKPARTPRAEEPLDAGALIEELKADPGTIHQVQNPRTQV